MPDSEKSVGWWKSQWKRPGLGSTGDLLAGFLMLGAAACLLASILCSDANRVYAWIIVAMLFIALAFVFSLILSLILGLVRRTYHHHHQLLYQSAGFVVLALSLRAFGMHDTVTELIRSLRHDNAQSPIGEAIDAHSMAELSSIMILFILIEIAAFVAHDVEEAKHEVQQAVKDAKETVSAAGEAVAGIKETSKQIAKLELVTSVATLDQSVMNAAVELIKQWSRRAPTAGLKRTKTTDLADECWRVLMREYLREETKDFKAEGFDGVPNSVRPLGSPGTDYNAGDVSYIATNIGFVASYVSHLVTELQANHPNEKVCVAVITNVLPAHWWNWTYTVDEWRAYQAITDLRRRMVEIAKNNARVDRLIAVWSDEAKIIAEGEPSYQPNKAGLWPEHLLYDMLTRWHLITNKNGDSLPCLNLNDARPIKIDRFPTPVRRGAESQLQDAKVYPMIRRNAAEIGENFVLLNAEWSEIALSTAYGELHQANGKYWSLPITENNLSIFDDHFDAMFIGVGNKDAGDSDVKGLWAGNEEVDWGVCLMNSADAAAQTMFLTVISGASAKSQFKHWRSILGTQYSFNWLDNLLPGKAVSAMERLTIKINPEANGAAGLSSERQTPDPTSETPPGG